MPIICKNLNLQPKSIKAALREFLLPMLMNGQIIVIAE